MSLHLAKSKEIIYLQHWSTENRIVRDESGEENRGPIMEGLKGHGKEFAFYSRSNGNHWMISDTETKGSGLRFRQMTLAVQGMD